MTWPNGTCDDCGGQTSGGPCLRDELWGTITRTIAVPIPCDPGQPFLFPLFQYFDSFLCLACIERRLGRQLTQEDLDTSPWNAGWIDNDNAGTSDSDDELFKKMVEKWKARRARGRRLLPHANHLTRKATPIAESGRGQGLNPPREDIESSLLLSGGGFAEKVLR